MSVFMVSMSGVCPGGVDIRTVPGFIMSFYMITQDDSYFYCGFLKNTNHRELKHTGQAAIENALINRRMRIKNH